MIPEGSLVKFLNDEKKRYEEIAARHFHAGCMYAGVDIDSDLYGAMVYRICVDHAKTLEQYVRLVEQGKLSI
jgi:hypothetical protein